MIYVGKALSLRKRTSNYFARDLHERTRAMVESARHLEWIVTDSEVAALMLEFSLIKRHRPRFNIRLVDDKSYPYLAITRSDEWPRARVMRGAKRKGVEYFGPYAHAYAIRSTLDLLLRTFPDPHLHRCPLQAAAGSGTALSPLSHREVHRALRRRGRPRRSTWRTWMASPPSSGVTPTRSSAASARKMLAASERQEYELAARYRDRLRDVERASERQEVVTDRKENFDLIALYGDDLETSVQVLHVRRGRVVGRLGSIVDRVEDVTDAQLVASLAPRALWRGDPAEEVLVQIVPEDLEVWEAWLGERRGARCRSGSRNGGPSVG